MTERPDPTRQYKVYKVIVVGNEKVGKSSFTHSQLIQSDRPTGLDLCIKTLQQQGVDDVYIKFQIWDTPKGNEKYDFKCITPRYYNNARGAFIVFDVTSKSSFKECENWIKLITQNILQFNSLPSQLMPVIILIGHKSDQTENREVTNKEAMDFANQYQIKYFETTARDIQSIEVSHLEMVSDLIKNDDILQLSNNNN